MIRTFRHFRIKRGIAAVTAAVIGTFCVGNPVAAALKSHVQSPKSKTAGDARETARTAAEAEFATEKPRGGLNFAERPLTGEEMQAKGRGTDRNANLCGTMPWHKSFRDVNMCTGNLFKSFTDIQVSPARGAGLAWQRTYNSNDDRVGPFGVGWTHAYDIRIEEGSTPNDVPRTDFFGGKHHYTRDADGLYTPPAYMFDELDSTYDDFLVNGPADVLTDDQKGMDGTVKHFVKNGNARTISTITDRHGNQTSFTYGLNVTIGGVNQNLLTRVTDPSGRYLDITWSDVDTGMGVAYRITQVAGPIDPNTSNPIYTVTYEYNGDFNLWKVHQDPSGLNRTTTFTYTTVNYETGLLASITDPLSHSVSYTYSDRNDIFGTVWVSSIVEPTSGGSLTWNLTASGSGFDGGPEAYFSTSSGLQSAEVWSDPYLRCTTVTASTPAAMYRYTYDSANNVVEEFGGATRYSISGSYLSSPYAYVVRTFGPHGNVLTESVQGFAGSTTTTTYYNASKYFQKASVTDPEGNVTQFDYFDNADMSIGNRGEVKWVRDARYGTTGEQFEYTYNSYGQKLTETNLKNVVTEYTYGDAWGNLTQVVQDPGMGHLNRTTEMEYDAAGRVIESTDPKNQTSTFEYNGVGQPTEADLPGETVTYTYGANGRTEEVTDNRGTTEITYETGNDRVASVEDPVTGTISYTYKPGGERATLVLPGGNTWTYSYAATSPFILPKPDPNATSLRLTKITDDQGKEVEYSLDGKGKLWEAKQNIATGISILTTYTYENNGMGNSRGFLTQIKNQRIQPPMSPTTIVQNDYTYDDNGNRLTNAISDNAGLIRTEEYGYDALNRLTSVDYDDGQTQSYAFDAMGNRTQKIDSVSGTENYTYNNANMLLTRGMNSYTNDGNGNTLTGGGRTNTWDDQNRLTQCVYSGTTTSFTYGADGLRRSSAAGGTTTNYIIEGDNVVRETQGGSPVATYLHGPRGPESRRDGSNVYRWYVYDGLGSVLAEVDASGAVTATRKYDVYGAVRATTGTGTSKHKFVGKLGHPSDDSTGLIYMRARYSDPSTGRFISQDPQGDGTNWFEYADSNPVSYVDKDGKRKLTFFEELTAALGTMYVGCRTSKYFKFVFISAFIGLLLPEIILLGVLTGPAGWLATCIAVEGLKLSMQAACDGLATSQYGIATEVIGFWTGYVALVWLIGQMIE